MFGKNLILNILLVQLFLNEGFSVSYFKKSAPLEKLPSRTIIRTANDIVSATVLSINDKNLTNTLYHETYYTVLPRRYFNDYNNRQISKSRINRDKVDTIIVRTKHRLYFNKVPVNGRKIRVGDTRIFILDDTGTLLADPLPMKLSNIDFIEAALKEPPIEMTVPEPLSKTDPDSNRTDVTSLEGINLKLE
ncbi:hypothetical protein O3M35_001851 [Rhynocoris fuscipes]|uniref:Uncharacterized protein n=1 Tax=Rhynocoris fuscipes TaxID=488301 RepID=A0AAW1CNX5_9HEMI